MELWPFTRMLPPLQRDAPCDRPAPDEDKGAMLADPTTAIYVRAARGCPVADRERDLEELKNFAVALSGGTIRVYEDEPTSDDATEAFRALVDDVRSGAVKLVVVSPLNRLGLGVQMVALLKRVLKIIGAVVVPMEPSRIGPITTA